MKSLSTPLCILLFIFLAINVQGQKSTESSSRNEASFLHQKKGQLVNLGLGLLTNPAQFSFDILGGGDGTGDPSPAINISYEYGLTKELAVGALIGYYRVNAQQELNLVQLINENILNDPACFAECLLPISISGNCDCAPKTVEERINVLTIAGKFSYHILRLPRIDTYTNLTVGYSFNRRTTIVDETLNLIAEQVQINTKVPKIIYFASVGARYFITPNIAAFGEFGYSNVHLLHTGISYRW